jgi:hypothetical protein
MVKSVSLLFLAGSTVGHKRPVLVDGRHLLTGTNWLESSPAADAHKC